jgi:colanic acid/amylovoran biosynthesis glycosyltransferase
MKKRKFLYVIVTDYPYGIGEPFLETELFILSSGFEKIYIVIPEVQMVDQSTTRYKLPLNAELVPLRVSAGKLEKVKALARMGDSVTQLEKRFVTKHYHQPFDNYHMRTLIGFRAMANAFSRAFFNILNMHSHPPEETTLYSYWFTYATAGLTNIKVNQQDYRVVTRIHGWDCYHERNPHNYLPLRPWVFSQIDGVYPISEQGLRYTIDKLPGIFHDNIHLFYLGIEDLPQPSIKTQEADKLHIVSLAFIDPVKQLDRIVDALSQVEISTIEWTHIGNAPKGNHELQDYANLMLKVKSNIKFSFTGEYTKDQVYNFFKSQDVDVLICTSRSEGLPVSMMEAMGHGIPVISVDVGGISEIVKDQFNGSLLPARADSKMIAQTLESWVLKTSEERNKLRNNAYQTYIEYFSATKNYTRFLKEALQG